MKRFYSILIVTIMMLIPMGMMGQTQITLFHETFGNNSGSARDWNNSYSVKSGVTSVYSDITSYVVSNLKQSKNTAGSNQSGLNQTTQGTDAYIEIGPLHVADYTDLSLTYFWKAASIKGTYSTNIYYKTSPSGTYSEVPNTAVGATGFVEVSVNMPTAAQTNTLYLKIVWNTSKTQAIIDEVDLQGVSSGGAAATTTTIDNSGITNTNKYVSTDAGSLSASVTYGDPATAVPNATVTWSGDNDAVATIDETTGAVTLVAAGTVTFTASYAGDDDYNASSATYEMTVTNENPNLTTIWSEDFATEGYSDRSTTYSYATTENSAVQNNDNYAGGTAPEMMVKGNGTFSATIPLLTSTYCYNGDLTLTYKTNANALNVKTTTTGLTVDGEESAGAGLTFSTKETHTITFKGVTTSTENITIVFTAGSSNVRLDDIVLKGEQAPLTTVATPVISPDGGAVVSGTEVTITCDTEGASIYYTTDGTTPTSSSTAYNPSNKPTITTAMTLKAIAVKTDMDDSNVAEATFTLLYTLTVDIEHVEYNSTLYDFYIEDEVEHWDDIIVDNGVALVRAGADVRISVDMVDDCYVLNGFNVTNGSTTIPATDHMAENGTYGFIMPESNATLTDETPQATQKTLTVTGLENVSYTNLQKGNNSDIFTLDANNQAEICEQLRVEVIDLTANSGYVLQSVTLTYGGKTITITPEYGVYAFTMPSANATLTFTTREVVNNTYTKVTSIMPGKHYIIVTAQASSNKYYAMGTKNSGGSYMNRIEVSIDGSTVSVAENAGVSEVAISGYENYYTLHTSEGYLVGGSKSMNTNGGATSYWNISFNDNNEASIEWNSSGYTIQYNASSPRFACYNTDQVEVCLYEKVGDTDLEIYSNTSLSSTNQIVVPANGILTVNAGTLTNTDPANLIVRDGGQLVVRNNGAKDALAATMEKHIAPWATNPVGGWYFIASPLDNASLNPADVNNMITADNGEVKTFDLYKYVANNTVGGESKPWYNYRAHSSDFVLANGQGYLYANASEQTLAFAGNIKPYSTTSNTVTLAQTGWNLIGNPFTCEVSVDKAFSELNNGTAVANKAVNSTIMPCAGIAVNGTANDVVTFTMVEPQQSAAPSNPSLQLTLAQQATNRGNAATLDNAIVSFNEGSELPKFYFMEQNANLYIPQGTEEYAIVSAEAQGEMPVNFKANQSGEYTISINTENVEMNYLHLIDNLTGNDVDLLATPSYTFNAKTDDYASRFRLVFSANNANNGNENDHFAFISNGQIVLTEEGNAQVFDVMGRMVSSHNNVNHITTEGLAAGVYVIRLTNGSETMTQKIVVK